jgi:hypothetical protein
MSWPSTQQRKSYSTGFALAGWWDHKVEEVPPRTPAQEKGHRLGIFLTVISVLILIFGLGAESNRIAGLGFMGVLFGYWVARLWYWFRSA